MEFKTYTVLTLLVCSSTAFAWQPLTYPIRSQSAYERSVDTAMCYAAANRTKVDIKREPQIPTRKAPPPKASSTGAPSRPPLPSSSFSAAPVSASMPAAATEPGASAPVATAATAPGASSVKSASAPTAGSEAMAATGASSTNADLGASGTAATSSQANAASGVKLPPLPEPEPPMARYWAAYAECMQARGYVVVQ
ncbi:hypothetical protein PQR02_20600 [Paraburkholderia sediminicola]|uniref:Uncharacterized protein n=1 Tax=Paraburkholderia rhynchosiae TaxID=487049 RepID=A0ACC7NA01_9BURK